MKFLRYIFRLFVAVVVLTYLGVTLITSIPFVQRWMAAQASDICSKSLGTNVSVSNVNVTMFGYAQIDSVLIEDRLGYPMIFATRISASISLPKLLRKTVHLEHAQLYGLRACLRREVPDSAWNFKFAIDALRSPKKGGDNPWKIVINSAMVRRGTVTVDVPYKPLKDARMFDPYHLTLRGVSVTGVVHEIEGDKIDVELRRLSLKEQGGLHITDLNARFTAHDDELALPYLRLRLPNSQLSINAAMKGEQWNVSTLDAIIDGEDVKYLHPIAEKLNTVSLHAVAHGNMDGCTIDSLQLWNDAVQLGTDMAIAFAPLQLSTTRTQIKANIPMLMSVLNDHSTYSTLPQWLTNRPTAEYAGSLAYSETYASVAGTIVTGQGKAQVNATLSNLDRLQASIKSEALDLSDIVGSKLIASFGLDAQGSLKTRTGSMTAHVPLIETGYYAYRNISLDARGSMATTDSIKARLAVADPNVAGRLLAVYSQRSIEAHGVIKHIAPDRLRRGLLGDTTNYAARIDTRLHIPANPLHTTGYVRLDSLYMNHAPVATDIVLSSQRDSVVQRWNVRSPYLQAYVQSSNIDKLIRNRRDSMFTARLQLWDESPLDSLLGINLSLQDTLTLEAKGHSGPLLASLSLHNRLRSGELHLDAKAGCLNDSVWLEASLQSADNPKAGGTVVAHTILPDSSGVPRVEATVHNLSIDYIMQLVNFHTLELSGQASGIVHLTEQPSGLALRGDLEVPDFMINYAPFGHLKLDIGYEFVPKRITLDGVMREPEIDSYTRVAGYIIPGHRPESGLDLKINTKLINATFLGMYTKDIFENLHGRASGTARVFGKMGGIDLEGDLCIDTVSLQVPVLGTGFTSTSRDSVILRPGVFSFPSINITDGIGGVGTVSGLITHTHFGNMVYDFNINAQKLLGYHFTTYSDMPFYATAVATGSVNLSGQPGRLNVDLKCRPEAGTTLVYNTSSPGGITSDNFIEYGSLMASEDADTITIKFPELPREDDNTSMDMRINFDLDITPDSHLRIVTDAVSGDGLNLYGDGHIMASYYNKGSFQMWGQYQVDHGDYNLSIQNFIRKRFDFRRGGTLTFSGPPMLGDLNLQAVYPVQGVSLGDLSSRATFASSGVRVDCIMNLGGKCEAPQVTFDFDLPNVNEDEKQMVRSLISTDEERNMQVLYLLGIGRFYSYDYSGGGSGQGNVAMKSLLSSTLSSTLNNVISNAIGNNNWTFGTSIATGDLGWSDMDVEGLISGRLFNNRLQINGQFGYRDRTTTGSNFIGDFDMLWSLTSQGGIALKAYSETNDRYFTKSALTTQGIGLLLKKDFNHFTEMFKRKKNK